MEVEKISRLTEFTARFASRTADARRVCFRHTQIKQKEKLFSFDKMGVYKK